MVVPEMLWWNISLISELFSRQLVSDNILVSVGEPTLWAERVSWYH